MLFGTVIHHIYTHFTAAGAPEFRNTGFIEFRA